MQCASCHFENMPGVPNCGRCGAVLNLASMPVEVHPPRARRWIKPWRRYIYFFTRRRRMPGGYGVGWGDGVHEHLAHLARNKIPWRIVLRMAVPGWPQLYLGRKLQGRIFFWGYLACMPLGLLYAGTNIGSLLMGLAMSLHAASVADIVISHSNERESRLLYSIACLSLVGFVLYLPAYRLITRVAVPQQFMMDSPPFQAGDVIIYNPSAYRHSEPQIGDLVCHLLPNNRVNALDRTGHHVIYDFTGQVIVGRIVAGPGQEIVFEKGQLTVNGKPSPWSQLFAENYQEELSATLPADGYFVLTNIPRTVNNPIPVNLRVRFSFAPRESIIGRVYFRTQPLSRFGAIR